ncbi:hypothetical protein [Zhihengliuella halotolerans]|uniref:hypothetical protein n=1 Tax=Zhihengliuella halotolerans TaxID=370736 RepID=UPI000C7FC660|nr:hypothetical protein [Zhihengliuella halotolerans]
MSPDAATPNALDDVNVPGGDATRFRRLCRSSPWRWESLRFSVEWRAPHAGADDVVPVPRVNAWLRRPDALRVESDDARLLFSTTRINDSKDAFYVTGSRSPWLLPPRLVAPVYDDEGLVQRRPEAKYGDPVFGNGRWAAMLDPVELAGNSDVPVDTAFENVVELHGLAPVTHAGRPAIEAVLTPNRSFEPAHAGQPLIGLGTPAPRTRVRIDAATSVCVEAEVLDGEGAGAGHSLSIHAVDEYMLDDLFVEHSVDLTDVRDHIPWVVGEW